MKTNHYDVFNTALNTIRKTVSSSDEYTTKLLFANVVTVFEAYLQSIALSLMQADKQMPGTEDPEKAAKRKDLCQPPKT